MVDTTTEGSPDKQVGADSALKDAVSASSEHGAPTPKDSVVISESAPQKKKGKKKWPIVAAVIVIVVAAAGGGFAVWHSQPSFCNAVCHVPMDNYVMGYASDSTLLANTHQKANAACLDCHEATIETQIAEGLSWVQGDFVTDEAGNLATAGITADKKMCAQSGCHDFTEVIAATENWGGKAGVNPHTSHQGEAIDCSNCHGVHGESNMYCNTCHDYKVPGGWTNPR